MFENLTSNLMEQMDYSREKSVVAVTAPSLVLTLLIALSFTNFSIFGNLNLFGIADFLVTDLLFPMGALASTCAVGWVMRESVLRENFGNKTLFSTWLVMLRFIAPVIIVAIFVYFLNVH